MRKTIFIFSLLLLPIFGANSASASYDSEQAEFTEKKKTVSWKDEIDNHERDTIQSIPSFTAQLKKMAKTAGLHLYNIGVLSYISEGNYSHIMKNGNQFERWLTTLTLICSAALIVKINKPNKNLTLQQQMKKGLPVVLPMIMTCLLLTKILYC